MQMLAKVAAPASAIIVAATLLAAETSVSQTSLNEDGVPVMIARSVAKQIRTCKGDISSLPTSLFSLDLNGDGRLDYVVNFENFGCEAVPSPFCGTGGCLHEIWLSNNEGCKLVLSSQANLIAGVDMIDGKPALRLLVHHRYCEMQPCCQNIVWSGGKLFLIAR